jgi:hypothetical protein
MHQRSKFIDESPLPVIKPLEVKVSNDSLQIYKDYVAMNQKLVISVSADSLKVYEDYVKNLL